MRNLSDSVSGPTINTSWLSSYSSSDSSNRHVRPIRSVTHGSKCRGGQIVAAVLLQYRCCNLNNSHFCQCVQMPSSPVLGVGSGQPIISGSSKPLDHKVFRRLKLRGHCNFGWWLTLSILHSPRLTPGHTTKRRASPSNSPGRHLLLQALYCRYLQQTIGNTCKGLDKSIGIVSC